MCDTPAADSASVSVFHIFTPNHNHDDDDDFENDDNDGNDGDDDISRIWINHQYRRSL